MQGQVTKDTTVKYLLLTEFEVRTANYWPSLFALIYGPSAKRAGAINQREITQATVELQGFIYFYYLLIIETARCQLSKVDR